MTEKIIKIKHPFECPYRYGRQYPQLSYVEMILKKPQVTYMKLCGVKTGLICSENEFSESCPLEDE